MAFDEPEQTGGVRLNPRDIVGHLLLVWTIEYIAHSPTQFSRPDKPSDVIVVDAVDLDQVTEDGLPGLCARRAWWRQAQLIQALRGKIGGKDPLLVRMSKGGATMGRNAPYVLTSMTTDPGCVQRANNWMLANRDFVPSTPLGASGPTAGPSEGEVYGGGPIRSDQPPAGHWAAQNPNLPPPRPVTPAPRPVTPQEETMLERMARQSIQHQGGPSANVDERGQYGY